MKKGVNVIQTVTPRVLECVGMVLEEVGEAHWTLIAVKFVGTAMKMYASHSPY